MGSSLLRSRRRVLAFVQLMLFAFSASTSLLPCLHSAMTHAVGSHGAATAAAPAHHASMPHAPTHDASVAHTPVNHAPTHETSCPWVVGCAGVAQLSLDAAWRSAEHRASTVAPVGIMLRHVTTDRDIDAPPPRA